MNNMWFDILKRSDEAEAYRREQGIDAYVVRESVWKKAYGTLGANDSSISTGKMMATFEEIEKKLNRKLTPHDFAFVALNFAGDVEKHLGLSEYKQMLQLFTDEDYQVDSNEGWSSAAGIRLALRDFQEELERLA
tara:strand:+ start:11993 stop:12397 length:405 start_codon:yes stop_codon:yes gene_type:complete